MGPAGQVCSATITSSILTANELQVKRVTLVTVAFFLPFISFNCKLQSFFNNLPLKSSARNLSDQSEGFTAAAAALTAAEIAPTV